MVELLIFVYFIGFILTYIFLNVKEAAEEHNILGEGESLFYCFCFSLIWPLTWFVVAVSQFGKAIRNSVTIERS